MRGLLSQPNTGLPLSETSRGESVWHLGAGDSACEAHQVKSTRPLAPFPSAAPLAPLSPSEVARRDKSPQASATGGARVGDRAGPRANLERVVVVCVRRPENGCVHDTIQKPVLLVGSIA